jgi:hypothetical protein
VTQAGRSTPGRGPLCWALLVVPLWLVLILCTHWEPVIRDGWTHAEWHRNHAVGLATIYDFCRDAYLNENPRLGQLLTLLAYTPGPYHPIITPIAELGLFGLLTVLALVRWPSVRRADDALVALIIVALLATCVPQFGPMLLYRPFTGNYTLGFTLNLGWLVPYRLALAAPGPPRRWFAPVILVLGVAAGLCNEHTGLTFLAMGLAASVVAQRRGELRLWMIAGLAGLAAGYVVLLTAPGQHVRYFGLADQAGIVERITDRGLLGNLGVLETLARALLPAVPLVVIGVLERRAGGPVARPAVARWSLRALALGGLACTLTLLASPKIGPRLYLASVALIAAGLAGWLGVHARSVWARRGLAVLSAAALAFVLLRIASIYRRVGPLGELRLARLEHAVPHSVVTVPRYPTTTGRYFLTDDFLVEGMRIRMAWSFGVQAVVLAPEP